MSPNVRPELLANKYVAAREAQLVALLTDLGLSRSHLGTVKTRNSWQAYHNWAHCVVVALLTDEGARHAAMGLAERRLLCLAALYHDFEHTGDTNQADVFNIAHAIEGARHWIQLLERGSITWAQMNAIGQLIFSTENSHARIPQSLSERILMDADLLATDQPDHELWQAALAEEIGQTVTDASTANFLLGQLWQSSWGVQRATAYLHRLVPGTTVGRLRRARPATIAH